MIDDDEVRSLEKTMNAHGTMWSRFLKAGANTNNEERIKNNMLNENCEIGNLYILRKDHKEVGKDYENETIGPPISKFRTI